MKVKIIFYVFALILAFVLGYYAHSVISKGNVKIKKVVVTKTEYIKVPTTPEEAFRCANSPITISAKENKNKIYIVAKDECKKAEAVVDVSCTTKKETKALMGGIIFILGVAVILLL